MSRIIDAISNLSPFIRHSVNWMAVGSSIAAFLDQIRGPAAAVASIMSAIWLALQIFAYFKRKAWRNRR